jgi:phage baseplate assembly protein W
MARSILGTDLRVVLGPPGLSAQDEGGLDVRRVELPRPGGRLDLAVVEGRENLAQALVLRILTPKGSLSELGHAEYGCRLGELIGRSRTDAVRALAKGFVLEAVAQEPRVEDRAVAFAFEPESEGPSELRFTLTVRPRDGTGDLQLALGLDL